MVASGLQSLASISAGINALWGLHGRQYGSDSNAGRNTRAMMARASLKRQKRRSQANGIWPSRLQKLRSTCQNTGKSAESVLSKIGLDDPLLGIAKHLEKAALEDEYFVKRKLYPNVDFYSGILLKAIGIPVEMFTVMFAIGRIPGWVSNWKEIAENAKSRIHRPRQIYTGAKLRHFVPMDQR